ncbi:xanthine dehydrogenase family protein subunit M [Mucilaginibacter robiniae]|uniref:Xanthine dehydrogenase family protein subunit M n=1 Tax=Mucilaginibacter robiniae TaxID=2728022 RepID=A0A7L5E003_9SPHI|nr:xanthine dehydrogenase family protein subunit M [Mucilaginibacter robiniae]QJD95609.1 xanthine dehydrogenase family protein subunit M [Mucilaginibacter robiniae]
MNPFKYSRAHDTGAAISQAATTNGAKFIAGGTNIIDLMKLYIENPPALIDINQLNLNKIEVLSNGNVMIGTLVKNSDLAYHPVISQKYPVLSEAILAGASAQLRNAASTGGNLMQRTRCPYFYDTQFPCNKRVPGSGCSAIPGYNRDNAVLGTSDKCIATHPSDMCVAMAALGAIIHVQGPKGTRTIPFADFHLLPGQTPHLEHNLHPGELITSVELPALPFAAKSHYLKARDRASYQFALASAAVALDIQNGTIKAARIALGGVGTKPWRSMAAEQALVGKPAGHKAYQAAAQAALTGAKAYKDNGFKIELAKRTLVQALTKVGGMA